jgi:hypothetical protein
LARTGALAISLSPNFEITARLADVAKQELEDGKGAKLTTFTLAFLPVVTINSGSYNHRKTVVQC